MTDTDYNKFIKIGTPRGELNQVFVTFPDYYKINMDGEGMASGGKYELLSHEPIESLVEWGKQILIDHQQSATSDENIHRKKMLKMEKLNSELKVVIDTLQTTLNRAKAELSSDVHANVFTKASNWAMNFGKNC